MNELSAFDTRLFGVIIRMLHNCTSLYDVGKDKKNVGGVHFFSFGDFFYCSHLVVAKTFLLKDGLGRRIPWILRIAHTPATWLVLAVSIILGRSCNLNRGISGENYNGIVPTVEWLTDG